MKKLNLYMASVDQNCADDGYRFALANNSDEAKKLLRDAGAFGMVEILFGVYGEGEPRIVDFTDV